MPTLRAFISRLLSEYIWDWCIPLHSLLSSEGGLFGSTARPGCFRRTETWTMRSRRMLRVFNQPFRELVEQEIRRRAKGKRTPRRIRVACFGKMARGSVRIISEIPYPVAYDAVKAWNAAHTLKGYVSKEFQLFYRALKKEFAFLYRNGNSPSSTNCSIVGA